jgi:hypothetical protein
MSTKAGDDIGAGDAIMLLLNKHPIVSICIGCLALYGISMLLFIQRYVLQFYIFERMLIFQHIFYVLMSKDAFLKLINTILREKFEFE